MSQRFSHRIQNEVTPGRSGEDVQARHPSWCTLSQRAMLLLFVAISSVPVGGERGDGQGYTGRHINGACHARWSSYAWRRMSARKVLSSNRISASATSSLGDIYPLRSHFLREWSVIKQMKCCGPNGKSLHFVMVCSGLSRHAPSFFSDFFFSFLFLYLLAVEPAGVWTGPSFEAHVTPGTLQIVTSDSFISLIDQLCDYGATVLYYSFRSVPFSLVLQPRLGPLTSHRSIFIWPHKQSATQRSLLK